MPASGSRPTTFGDRRTICIGRGPHVAVGVEADVAGEAILDVGGEELLGHRRAAAVGARDRVEQDLGRLGGVDGVRGHDGAGLGRPELLGEPLPRRPEALDGHALEARVDAARVVAELGEHRRPLDPGVRAEDEHVGAEPPADLLHERERR